MPMGYCVIDASLIGELGINGERYNAVRPTELCPCDDDGLCIFLLVDLSHQLLHFVDTSQHDVALEDGLTVDDTVSHRAVSKGIAFDKTPAYFWARTKLFFCHFNTLLFLVEIRLFYLSNEN